MCYFDSYQPIKLYTNMYTVFCIISMWRPEYKILETWYLWLSSYGLPLLERLGGREANKVISETGIAIKTISHRHRCYWSLHISLNITLWCYQENNIMATLWGWDLWDSDHNHFIITSILMLCVSKGCANKLIVEGGSHKSALKASSKR